MRRKALPKLVGKYVQLFPQPKRIDSGTVSVVKSDWFVERLADDGVWLSLSSGHGFNLKGDHLHDYRSDPRGEAFGILVLTSQVLIDGVHIRLTPIAGRPGSAA